MTGGTAAALKLADRGLLREGWRADVTLFDPADFKERATYERPHQYPIGISWVLVNGVVTVRNGQHTGARAGRALYGPGYRKGT
jgi:N-acyl-D-aspartate/D-glutamate deacylase